MKKKLAALAGVIAVIASSFAFVGTPKASAMYDGQSFGGCYYTIGWIIYADGSSRQVLIQHC
jgi:hypothetical protein